MQFEQREKFTMNKAYHRLYAEHDISLGVEGSSRKGYGDVDTEIIPWRVALAV